MFLRSSKFLLLFIWIFWLAASSLCLALDQHACCPTGQADWHMDTLQACPRVETDNEVKKTENVTCETDQMDCPKDLDSHNLKVEPRLPLANPLLIRSTYNTLAPPTA